MPAAPKQHVPAGHASSKDESQWASRRAPWRRWYFTAHWNKLRRLVFDRDSYLCRLCGGVVTDVRGAANAAHADHVRPHNGDWDKFADLDNLQTLCAGCHSRKTAKHDQGFGNFGSK